MAEEEIKKEAEKEEKVSALEMLKNSVSEEAVSYTHLRAHETR